MAKKTKKDLRIEDLEKKVSNARLLAGKLFSHLIELNIELACVNGVERHYGDVQSHIDFNKRMIDTFLQNKKHGIKITIEGT